MKSLLALLALSVLHPTHETLLLRHGRAAARLAQASSSNKKGAAFLTRNRRGVQPWLYNPPPAVVPRGKPLEIPGGPVVLPPVDKLWGMQPTASPPTIEPPENKGETGLQQTVPPKALEGWYATIPPEAIKAGLV